MKICANCEHTFSTSEWVCPKCGHEPEILEGYLAHSPKLAETGKGFKPESFPELARLEAANFWFCVRNELIIWALNTYAADARSFLEVGCGTGFVLSGIAKARPEMKLSGSELFPAGLPYANARAASANLMQMDARYIPYKAEFDAIGAFDVIEHITEDELVLAQLYKALKSGGVLLLTVPQHPWLWSATDERACHVRRYTALELRDKAVRAGFHVERSTSFVSLLLPAMAFSRYKKAPSSSDKVAEYDLCAELRLPSALNETFYRILTFERKLIQMGINFGAGGSRLMVLRKLDQTNS
jgi:SAM-dependent methyltransferase